MSLLDEYVLELLFYVVVIVISIISVCFKKKDKNVGDSFPSTPLQGSQKMYVYQDADEKMINAVNPRQSILNVNDGTQRVPPQREQEVRRYLAIHFPDYNEQAEEENIRKFLTEYLWAVGKKSQDLSSFKSMCSMGVITELSQDIALNKLTFNSVTVTNVQFAGHETLGKETTIIYYATAEYTAGERDTHYICQYKLKYGRVIREENGKRKSITCPNCGAPVSAEEYGKKLTCDFCGEQFGTMGQKREWSVVNIDRMSNRFKYMG